MQRVAISITVQVEEKIEILLVILNIGITCGIDIPGVIIALISAGFRVG